MWELVDFVAPLLSEHPRAIACGLVGMLAGLIAGAGGALSVTRLLGRWRPSASDREASRLRDELREAGEDGKAADARAATLERELADRDAAIAELKEACDAADGRAAAADRLRDELSDRDRRLAELKEFSDAEKTELADEVARLGKQLQEIVDTDGRLWERPVGPDVPPFVPRRDRRAVVVAVVNLKGGVGKTTLSANVGAVLAAQGDRVLLVDLDHQHSLSDLCFPNRRRRDLIAGGRVVDRYFDPAGEPPPLAAAVERVGDASLFCLACDEGLADVEAKATAHWLAGTVDGDVRFRLRGLLHDESVAGEFDWIVLDCPPRLTPGTVNALAACDEVLVPVLLDATSTNAVPRLVQWLYRLKHDAKVCPDASLLGVVANGTYRGNDMTRRELDIWRNLSDQTSDRWDSPVHFFERFVPHKKSAIADAAAKSGFAAFDASLEAVFLDLVSELRARVPRHDRLHAPGVS